MTPKRNVATYSLPRKRTGVFSLAADGSGAAGTEVEGYIVIQIGDEKFTLVGKVGATIYVAYHKPFEEAFPLGTIPQMLGQVATALGIPNAAGFEKSVNDTLGELAKIPALGKVVEVLMKGVFKVTDLVIDTRNPDAKTYEFGFGVDTSETVDSIPLAAFGVKFTYTSTKPSP